MSVTFFWLSILLLVIITSTAEFTFRDFHKWNEIENYIKTRTDLQLHRIGESHENRTLYVLQCMLVAHGDSGAIYGGTIESGPSEFSASGIGSWHYGVPEFDPLQRYHNFPQIGPDSGQPSIWVGGGLHAREWISPPVVLYLMEQVARSTEFRNLTWYFAPMVNPDGYVHTWIDNGATPSDTRYNSDIVGSNGQQVNRFWRKNRSPERCVNVLGRTQCCRGVDLNRNFNVNWGDRRLHTTGVPCLSYYHGRYPFSEPEARAIKDFVTDRAANMAAYLSFHSYGQLWMYPYSYSDVQKPKHLEEMSAVAARAVSTIRSYRGTVYEAGQASTLRQKAPGTEIDWAKRQGIKYTFGIELPPSGEHELDGFLMEPTEILHICREAWLGVRVVADTVLKETGTQRA